MKKLLLILIVLIPLTTSAQKRKKLSIRNRRATELYYKALSFYDRTDLLSAEKFLKEGIRLEPKFIEAHLVIAQIYFERGLPEKAIEHLTKAHEINRNFFPKSFYTLGILYFSTGQYEQALESFKTYLSYNESGGKLPQLAGANIKRCEKALKAIANPVPYKPVNMGDSINSQFDEYWPSLSVDEQTLVYTVRLPKEKELGIKGTRWQEDFYASTRNASGSWSKGKPLGKPINTDFNEGAQSLSADGNTMYFTVCRGVCNLYYAVRNPDRSWSKPVKLPPTINTQRYSEKQPSISPDGKTLYFVSNRRGGKGSFDIWKSERNPDGSWGNATNLGGPINTPGSEQSPFIHFDNQTLYFSSNGHGGMGSQDLYLSRKNQSGNWSKPVNLGYPINTHKSEEGLVINARGNKAYYSSYINPEKGRDIITFELYPEIRPIPTSYVKGRVRDSQTLNPVEATITLVNLATQNIVMNPPENPDGTFTVCLPTNRQYALFASAPGYLFHSEHFNLTGHHSFNHPYQLDILLNPITINQTLIMRNVLFELDSYKLKPESSIELDRVVAMLKQNPTLKVEIGGHTDNQGDESYNQILSEKRAEAVVRYLTRKGIEASRLSWKGYGEKVPIETNSTAEGRAKNRRTEMRIIGR